MARNFLRRMFKPQVRQRREIFSTVIGRIAHDQSHLITRIGLDLQRMDDEYLRQQLNKKKLVSDATACCYDLEFYNQLLKLVARRQGRPEGHHLNLKGGVTTSVDRINFIYGRPQSIVTFDISDEAARLSVPSETIFVLDLILSVFSGILRRTDFHYGPAPVKLAVSMKEKGFQITVVGPDLAFSSRSIISLAVELLGGECNVSRPQEKMCSVNITIPATE